MESPDLELLSLDFWQRETPDVRLNPLVPFDDTGLGEFLAREPDLRGHVIFATSGSSGAPRLVCLSREALLASARAVNAHLEISAKDRWLCALPAFHVGGFGIWARAFAASGIATDYRGRWDASRFLETCRDQEITLTSLVGVQVFDLIQAGLRGPETLRAIVVGGGAMSLELGQKARDLGWPVLQSFGMTEAGSQIATQRLADLDSPFRNADLSVLPNWETRANSAGRLEIRGKALFSAYLENAAGNWKLVRPFDSENWFSTQDLVKLGPGTLTPLGRGGRTVKILGELVNLDGLEDLLHELADHHANHVTLETVPDERSGRRLVLVSEPGISPQRLAELRTAYDENVAPFERIRELATVSAFPRSPLGKIQRRRLEELISAP